MKYILIVLFSLIFTSMKLITCSPAPEMTEEFDWNKNIELCAAEIGLLVEETKRSFTMPVEVPGNCVTACMWRRGGLMSQDEKIIKTEMMASMHPSFNGLAVLTKKNEDDFSVCVDEANKFDGGCLVVSEYFKCLIKMLLSSNE